MRILVPVLEIMSVLAFTGLALVLAWLAWGRGDSRLLLILGLLLLLLVMADNQILRLHTRRVQMRAYEDRLAAIGAYSELVSETRNLCAGMAVSLSLCSHYCFSDPRKMDSELNRMWGALEEFRNVALPRAEQVLMRPGGHPYRLVIPGGRQSAAAPGQSDEKPPAPPRIAARG